MNQANVMKLQILMRPRGGPPTSASAGKVRPFQMPMVAVAGTARLNPNFEVENPNSESNPKSEARNQGSTGPSDGHFSSPGSEACQSWGEWWKNRPEYQKMQAVLAMLVLAGMASPYLIAAGMAHDWEWLKRVALSAGTFAAALGLGVGLAWTGIKLLARKENNGDANFKPGPGAPSVSN